MAEPDNDRRDTSEDAAVPDFDPERPNRPSDDDQEIALAEDRPAASLDGVTVEEQRRGDSVRTRAAREQPEADLRDDERRPGRLVEPHEGTREDTDAELVASEAERSDGLSSEEAALHYEDEPEIVREDDEPA